MPHKFVRVRLGNGSEKTVTELIASRYDLEVLDKPTHGLDGRPLPPKPRLPLGTSASAKKSPTAKAKTVSADESQED
jgi:hypothetical protein